MDFDSKNTMAGRAKITHGLMPGNATIETVDLLNFNLIDGCFALRTDSHLIIILSQRPG
jgi:hypothetical protein